MFQQYIKITLIFPLVKVPNPFYKTFPLNDLADPVRGRGTTIGKNRNKH